MSKEKQPALLTLKRPKNFNAQVRRFEVLLDNQFLTHLKNGETKTLEIPARSHQLKARVFPFAQSKDVSFEVESNTAIAFEVLLSATDPSANKGRFQSSYWVYTLIPFASYILKRIDSLIGFKLTLVVIGLILTGTLIGATWWGYKLCKGMVVRQIDVTASENAF